MAKARWGIEIIQDREASVVALDASIARGVAGAEEGRTTAAAAVFDRLEVKYGAATGSANDRPPPGRGRVPH